VSDIVKYRINNSIEKNTKNALLEHEKQRKETKIRRIRISTQVKYRKKCEVVISSFELIQQQ